MTDLVITCLLTRHPDPQRGHRWPADPATITVLDSLGDLDALVLHDECDTTDPRFHPVAPSIENAYFARWEAIAGHLAGHPEVERVWCVDGTDVDMLHDPFPHMAPDTLYIGSEPLQVGCPWMRATNPDLDGWIRDNGWRRLLNPGLVGGPADEVRRWAEKVAGHWPTGDLTDMGAANAVTYQHWPHHITGPKVHTPYRAQVRTGTAWWRHK